MNGWTRYQQTEGFLCQGRLHLHSYFLSANPSAAAGDKKKKKDMSIVLQARGKLREFVVATFILGLVLFFYFSLSFSLKTEAFQSHSSTRPSDTKSISKRLTK